MMNNDEWYKYNMTLYDLAYDLYFEKNIQRFDEIANFLDCYSLENIIVGDIKDFIKRKLAKDINLQLSDTDIFNYITNPEYRDALIEFGQLRNPIDTIENDLSHRDYNDDWDQLL